MEPGTYAIKEGKAIVAYLRVTPTGTTWTPKGVKGQNLATLQKALEDGHLPDGLTANEIEVATGFVPSRPDFRAMTPSTGKRNRWLASKRNRSGALPSL